jgi:hypothetical protein
VGKPQLGYAELVTDLPPSTFAFVLRRVDQLFAADPARARRRGDRIASGMSVARSGHPFRAFELGTGLLAFSFDHG